MRVTFISGWSGLPCLYPDIAAHADVITPYCDHSPEQTTQAIAAGGDLLMAWSTGAHLVLDQLSLAGDNFQSIILIAPFLDFTSSVPPRIIKRMKNRLLREPEATVSAFWTLCGGNKQCPELSQQQVDHLATGLDLLMNSRVLPSQTTGAEVTLVRCLQDEVVLPAAFNEVNEALGQATVITCAGPHMLREQELIRIVSDVSGTTFF